MDAEGIEGIAGHRPAHGRRARGSGPRGLVAFILSASAVLALSFAIAWPLWLAATSARRAYSAAFAAALVAAAACLAAFRIKSRAASRAGRRSPRGGPAGGGGRDRRAGGAGEEGRP